MIVVQTPLRISFAGGGTDLPAFYEQEPGKVLSTAIDKYIFVIITERFDDQIYVNYTQKEIVSSADQIQHELVREAMLLSGVESGVEVTMLADIPSEGSGLGSSSSLTVGLINAFHQYRGIQLRAGELAEMACHIEIEKCGKPIGKQDQYIAAYGGIREFIFQSDGRVSDTPLQLEPTQIRQLSNQIMLFYTDKTRNSSNILTEQRDQTPNKMPFLRRMRDYVTPLRGHLESGDLKALGEVLHESWLLKQKLAGNISNKDIDAMYHRARLAGATGGKIAGAGGGGFLLLHVPYEKQESVRRALNAYREFPIQLERDGSKAIFNLRRQSAK